MTGRGRGRLGGNRHRATNSPRTFEHRLAGGTHRKSSGSGSNAMVALAVAFLAVPVLAAIASAVWIVTNS